jgi:hypothetical protein
MIQVPQVIFFAPAAFAIQAFEKSVRTGSQGALIHSTSTIPHTGAYSIVHREVDVVAETISRDNPNAKNARKKEKYLIRRKVKK